MTVNPVNTAIVTTVRDAVNSVEEMCLVKLHQQRFLS